jgi:hypothetical protein
MLPRDGKDWQDRTRRRCADGGFELRDLPGKHRGLPPRPHAGKISKPLFVIQGKNAFELYATVALVKEFLLKEAPPNERRRGIVGRIDDAGLFAI